MNAEIISAGIAFVGVVLSALISYWASKAVHVRNQIFDLKNDALLAELTFLDDYLSWLQFTDENCKSLPSPLHRNITSLVPILEARMQSIHDGILAKYSNERILQPH